MRTPFLLGQDLHLFALFKTFEYSRYGTLSVCVRVVRVIRSERFCGHTECCPNPWPITNQLHWCGDRVGNSGSANTHTHTHRTRGSRRAACGGVKSIRIGWGLCCLVSAQTYRCNWRERVRAYFVPLRNARACYLSECVCVCNNMCV